MTDNELIEKFQDILLNPQWEKSDLCHDWRNHVGKHTKNIWESLTLNQRLAIMLDSIDNAYNEEWE